MNKKKEPKQFCCLILKTENTISENSNTTPDIEPTRHHNIEKSFYFFYFWVLLHSFSKFIFHIRFVLCSFFLLCFNNIIPIDFSFLCFNKSGRSSMAATPRIYTSSRTSFVHMLVNKNLKAFLSEGTLLVSEYNADSVWSIKMHETLILHRSHGTILPAR